MRERIKQIMDKESLQASTFADKIGVSRGTISHILNGRMIDGVRIFNDPRQDTIDKILKTFPHISKSWVLSGEGSMYSGDPVSVQQPVIPSVQLRLFDEKENAEKSEKSKEHENSHEEEVKNENKTDSITIQNINQTNIPAKRIDKIMIFFTDKTFMTFVSEE